MSYILDALRKSESERRQGRVPDLGQQVQLIHKPRKKSSALPLWIAAGLALNAAVLGFVFWPDSPVEPIEPRETIDSQDNATAEENKADTEEPIHEKPVPEEPIPEESGPEEIQPVEPTIQERPTIIVPSRESSPPPSGSGETDDSRGTVPHLVELPLAFQKSIPDLVFNSHIYASEPSSRRVMINSNYLKAGDSFSGIRVERITEEGVVLSKNGRSFRVGTVRDWVTPE